MTGNEGPPSAASHHSLADAHSRLEHRGVTITTPCVHEMVHDVKAVMTSHETYRVVTTGVTQTSRAAGQPIDFGQAQSAPGSIELGPKATTAAGTPAPDTHTQTCSSRLCRRAADGGGGQTEAGRDGTGRDGGVDGGVVRRGAMERLQPL